jgi:hypothetical protein
MAKRKSEQQSEGLELDEPVEEIIEIPLQEYLDTSRNLRSRGDYAMLAFKNACRRHHIYHLPLNRWEDLFNRFMESQNSSDAFASEVNQ